MTKNQDRDVTYIQIPLWQSHYRNAPGFHRPAFHHRHPSFDRRHHTDTLITTFPISGFVATEQSSTGPKTFVGTFVAPPSFPPSPSDLICSYPLQGSFSGSRAVDVYILRAPRNRLQSNPSQWRRILIRPLSLQVLDTDTVEAEQRLESQRLATQAKWRFEVGRRTMLMDALNSTAATLSSGCESDKGNAMGDLITQLATSVACCDTQMTSILQAMDQQIQLSSLQYKRQSSALSVAVRKLNKTCERQAGELKHALTRIRDLEDELEEVWKEAETLPDDQKAVDKIKQERRDTLYRLEKKAGTNDQLKEVNDAGNASTEKNVTDIDWGGNNDRDHESTT